LASKCYQSAARQPTGPSETSVGKVPLVLVINALQKFTQSGAKKTDCASENWKSSAHLFWQNKG